MTCNKHTKKETNKYASNVIKINLGCVEILRKSRLLNQIVITIIFLLDNRIQYHNPVKVLCRIIISNLCEARANFPIDLRIQTTFHAYCLWM